MITYICLLLLLCTQAAVVFSSPPSCGSDCTADTDCMSAKVDAYCSKCVSIGGKRVCGATWAPGCGDSPADAVAPCPSPGMCPERNYNPQQGFKCASNGTNSVFPPANGDINPCWRFELVRSEWRNATTRQQCEFGIIPQPLGGERWNVSVWPYSMTMIGFCCANTAPYFAYPTSTGSWLEIFLLNAYNTYYVQHYVGMYHKGVIGGSVVDRSGNNFACFGMKLIGSCFK